MNRRMLLILALLAAALLVSTGVLAGVLIAQGGDEGHSTPAASRTTSRDGSKAWLGLTVSAGGLLSGGGDLFRLGSSGLRVASVEDGGPAATAGIQVNDVVRSVDGLVVRTPEGLRRAVEEHKPGDRVSLTYERGDHEYRADVRLTTAPANAQIESPLSPPRVQAAAANQGRLGVRAQPVTPELKQALGLQRDDGVVVLEATQGSAAANAGLRRGDVILSFGATQVRSVEDLQRAVNVAPANQAVDVRLQRGADTLTMKVTLGAAVIQQIPGLPQQLQEILQRQLQAGNVTPEQLQTLARLAQADNVRTGTVVSADASTLKYKLTSTGEEVSAGLTPQTRVRRMQQTIQASDLKAGEVVLVLSLDGGKTAVAVLAYGG
jgi:membrane-associated protease RseP (regulator of RpoE activity)